MIPNFKGLSDYLSLYTKYAKNSAAALFFCFVRVYATRVGKRLAHPDLPPRQFAVGQGPVRNALAKKFDLNFLERIQEKRAPAKAGAGPAHAMLTPLVWPFADESDTVPVAGQSVSDLVRAMIFDGNHDHIRRSAFLGLRQWRQR